MYKDVGKELKRCAEIIVVLLTVPSILVGIAVLAVLADNDLMILGLIAAAVVIGIGYFFARLLAMGLYAFGELVDRVCAMEERSREKKPDNEKTKTDEKTKPSEESIPVVERKNGTWQCLYCDHKNPSKLKYCEKCGFEAHFSE